MSERPDENVQAGSRVNKEETLFYTMQRLKSGEELDTAERERLTALAVEKMQPENTGAALLEMVRCAKEQNDIEMLRYAVNILQQRVHEGTNLFISPVSDDDLQKFLKTGLLKIYVGTGTLGHRILIDLEENTIFMPDDRMTRDDNFSNNFRKLFGIKDDASLHTTI